MGEIRTAVCLQGRREEVCRGPGHAKRKTIKKEKPLILRSRKRNNLKINVNQNGILDEELYS
jgi:hypothetical protein